MKKKLSAIAILLLVGIFIFWMTKDLNNISEEKPFAELDVSVYFADVNILTYFAQEKGYFRRNGLKVNLRPFGSAHQAFQDLINGNSNLATVSEFVFAAGIEDNPDVRVLGTLSHFSVVEVVARSDHGIATPNDLRGKKIGVLQNSSSEFFLSQYLSVARIPKSDVEIIHMGPREIYDSLLNGSIDAASTWEPNVNRLRSILGKKLISLNQEIRPEEAFLLVGRKGWLEENSKTVKAYMASLVDAETYFLKQPKKLKGYLKMIFGYGELYSREAVKNISPQITLSDRLVISLEEETEWAISQGIFHLESVPNFLNYLYTQPLKEVQPAAVTVVE